jgi:hypothetical protein
MAKASTGGQFEMITGHPPFDYDKEEDMDDDNSEDKLEQKILNDEVDWLPYGL